MNNKLVFFVLLTGCVVTAVGSTLWATYQHTQAILTAPNVAACLSIAQMILSAGLLVNQMRQGKINPWYAINVILSAAVGISLLVIVTQSVGLTK